jgi:hypothetical protein
MGETGAVTEEQSAPNVDVVIDCADPGALAGFWAAALGCIGGEHGGPHGERRARKA